VNPALHIVLYGLVAATSPLALGATIVVLTSGRGRLNGTAFAIGVLVGQTLVIALLALLGAAWVPAGDPATTFRAILDLLLGAALLVAGRHVLRLPAPVPHPPGPRTAALQARLAGLGPASALGTGALLGIGGPKRLALTILAASTVAAADASRSAEVTLGIVYILLATVLAWAPVVLYLVLADRATDWLQRRQDWVRAHQRPIVGYSSFALGAILIVGGILQALEA
jgi:threonine/homoserine/homoserine lactone efflux protein